jgi:hypothetical protein
MNDWDSLYSLSVLVARYRQPVPVCFRIASDRP